jgi:hypothetical protein
MEALIAAVILSVAVVAVTEAVVSGQSQHYDSRHVQRAMMLASEAMEWVLALPYEDPDGASNPGPEGGESSRSRFDNADDYHNYSQTGAGLVDLAGQTYPTGFRGFTRRITCQYGSLNLTGLSVVTGLTVTVTVTDADDRSWTLRRFVPAPALIE